MYWSMTFAEKPFLAKSAWKFTSPGTILSHHPSAGMMITMNSSWGDSLLNHPIYNMPWLRSFLQFELVSKGLKVDRSIVKYWHHFHSKWYCRRYRTSWGIQDTWRSSI